MTDKLKKGLLEMLAEYQQAIVSLEILMKHAIVYKF